MGRKCSSRGKVERERVLELEEDGAELVAETAGGIDDQVDGFLFDGEPSDVTDVPATLDGAQEAGRGLLSPGVKALRRRLPIKGVC
jgi:hypothetical protein